MFNKHKNARNASIDETPPSEDVGIVAPENSTIDNEEIDLINFDQDHNTPSSDSPPTMVHAYASVAHNLVTGDPESL